jgi:hypothetical protein
MMIRSRTPLLLLTVLWACGGDGGTDPDSDSEAETGSVTVTAVTTGADLDTEYGVTIDSLSGTVPANGSVTITNVPVGAATGQLTGVAANCAVTGSTSQSVTVAANTAAPAAFAVVCEPAVNAQAIASLEEAMFTALNIDAVSGLDDVSFAESNGLFLDALSASPTNETALFGAAMTGIFLLEDNTDVRAVVEDWEAWLEDEPTAPPVAMLLGPALTVIGDPITLPLSLST